MCFKCFAELEPRSQVYCVPLRPWFIWHRLVLGKQAVLEHNPPKARNVHFQVMQILASHSCKPIAFSAVAIEVTEMRPVPNVLHYAPNYFQVLYYKTEFVPTYYATLKKSIVKMHN